LRFSSRIAKYNSAIQRKNVGQKVRPQTLMSIILSNLNRFKKNNFFSLEDSLPRPLVTCAKIFAMIGRVVQKILSQTNTHRDTHRDRQTRSAQYSAPPSGRSNKPVRKQISTLCSKKSKTSTHDCVAPPFLNYGPESVAHFF